MGLALDLSHHYDLKLDTLIENRAVDLIFESPVGKAAPSQCLRRAASAPAPGLDLRGMAARES